MRRPDDRGRYQTQAASLDGRPLIEVTSMVRNREQVELRGTASVYEATILIQIRSARGTERAEMVGVTAGGPARGEWTVTLATHGGDELVIGQPESEESEASAHQRRIVIPLK